MSSKKNISGKKTTLSAQKRETPLEAAQREYTQNIGKRKAQEALEEYYT